MGHFPVGYFTHFRVRCVNTDLPVDPPSYVCCKTGNQAIQRSDFIHAFAVNKLKQRQPFPEKRAKRRQVGLYQHGHESRSLRELLTSLFKNNFYYCDVPLNEQKVRQTLGRNRKREDYFLLTV